MNIVALFHHIQIFDSYRFLVYYLVIKAWNACLQDGKRLKYLRTRRLTGHFYAIPQI